MTEIDDLLDTDELDNADLSSELTEASREMRRRLLQMDDKELSDLYYKALTFTAHEAARRARAEVLNRSNLSNRAEA